MLDVVEVGRDLCEQGEEAPVVAEVDGHQGQEGRRRQDRRERRERQLAALVAWRDVGLDVASLLL